MLKKALLTLVILVYVLQVQAQCSICTKTASQLGAKSAEGLNFGILYLMLTPLALIGLIGYRWWRKEKQVSRD